MKRFLKYFLRGLLVFVPVGVTIFILVYVFNGLYSLFSFLLPFIKYPVLRLLAGLSVTLGGIFLIGLFASNFVGKKLFGLLDNIFNKVPLVKMLYSAIKDLVEAFAGEKKKFDKPVLGNARNILSREDNRFYDKRKPRKSRPQRPCRRLSSTVVQLRRQCPDFSQRGR